MNIKMDNFRGTIGEIQLLCLMCEPQSVTGFDESVVQQNQLVINASEW